MDVPQTYLDDDYLPPPPEGKQLKKIKKIDMSECESYPIKMVALRIGWIINTPEGRDFLQAVLDTGNMEFFNIKSLQIIIEYLYVKIKGILIKEVLSKFMIQAVVFHLIFFTNELSFE